MGDEKRPHKIDLLAIEHRHDEIWGLVDGLSSQINGGVPAGLLDKWRELDRVLHNFTIRDLRERGVVAMNKYANMVELGGPTPAVRDAASDSLQRGWSVMRLKPLSKKPALETHDVSTITWDNINTVVEGDNIGVRFTERGSLKDIDLDYQSAADLVVAFGLHTETAAFGRPSVGVGHLLYDAPGLQSHKFNLPESDKYLKPLPLHNGKPSLCVLEIRGGSDNTYTMLPPSVHPEGETLDWVGERREPAAKDAAAVRLHFGRLAFASAVLYFYPTDATARYEVRMGLAGALIGAGMNADQASSYVQQVARLGGDPKWQEDFADHTEKRLENNRTATGLPALVRALQLPEACERTFREWLQVTNNPDLAEMNERCAAGSVKGKFRVIKWVPDARHPYQRVAEFYSKGDFCNAIVNPKIEVPKFNSKGEKIGTESIGRGKWWLLQDGRQEFDGIDYRPGQPEKIDVHDRHNGSTLCILNMYSGFAVEPDFEDSAKKCSLYLAHVHDNVAGSNEELNKYILDWQASGVQHPENPGRSALSMRGDPGAGKGVFALYYGGIFGRHFLHVTNKDHVTGKFNAHSAETCLIFVDEALYAEIRADAQILKTLTSETTKILERKGIDPVEIDNYARLMFATNEEHPIQIEHNDRRYCAIYVQNNSAWANDTSEQVKADKRAKYFRPILDEMHKGGRAALLGFLLRRDISKFNPERIPDTAERNAQKLMSAPAGDKIVIEFAIDGHLPGAVGVERPWLARANGDGCLYPSMRERGGAALARMTDMGLAGLLKRWGFSRHPLGDGAGWSAPTLADLRRAISVKYPGRNWDARIGDWGQHVDAAAVEEAKKVDDDPPF